MTNKKPPITLTELMRVEMNIPKAELESCFELLPHLDIWVERGRTLDASPHSAS